MEIKENMYVRMKYSDLCERPCIRKIIDIDEEDNSAFLIDDFIIDEFGDEQNIIREEHIEKASNNIIDLIKVGDYVNGQKVDWVGLFESDDTECVCHTEMGYVFRSTLKYIVTKEEFEAIKYEVE